MIRIRHMRERHVQSYEPPPAIHAAAKRAAAAAWEDWKGRLLADIAIYSTHEGDFSYVEPRAALPEGPVLPDHATLSAAGPEAAHSALRALCAPTGRAGDYYGFAAAGSDERVVSLPSPWLARQNEEAERVSQYFRDLFRPRLRGGGATLRPRDAA